MARYLDPRNDLIFKRIFADHPGLLIHFLNAIMPFEPERHIVTIEYLPAELVPENPGKKFSIVDVRCKDNFGRQFIVEMQMFWNEEFFTRIVFNAGKAYVRQLDRGDEYYLLQPVYTLALLDENFDRKTDRFYHHYQIVNRENTDEVIPGLEFILVELTEKFRPETMNDRKLMVLWLRFLTEVNEKLHELPPEMQENEHIRKAAELCEIGAFTPAELDAYDKYWDYVRVEKAIREGARREGLSQGRAEGRAQGRAEGRAEGRIEGRAEGRIEGRAEVQEKTVINGHRKGWSIADIADITGLMYEQVVDILKNHGLA
jgi:predicted transposase/invertase (TIGR01784 family)